MKRVYQFRPKGLLTLLLSVIAFSVSAQSITVRGTVTDQNNEPVIGATVVVEGNTNQGTVTDVDGNYVLSNVRSDARLIFSFVGMKTQTVPVNGQSRIDVTLSEDTEMLEEVVVTALGMKREQKALGYADRKSVV